MTDEEIKQAWMLVNKYGPANSWTGTGGTLAAALGRALEEIERRVAKTPELQQVNEDVAPESTQEPVAWAAVTKNGRPMWLSYSRQDAEGAVVGMAEVIPLYRQPQTCPYVVGRTTQHCSLTPFTLTDDERGAIAYYVGTGGPDRVDATLRSLLERTK
jgi:hypothetical protein